MEPSFDYGVTPSVYHFTMRPFVNLTGQSVVRSGSESHLGPRVRIPSWLELLAVVKVYHHQVVSFTVASGRSWILGPKTVVYEKSGEQSAYFRRPHICPHGNYMNA